jgi:hypothetical protein
VVLQATQEKSPSPPIPAPPATSTAERKGNKIPPSRPFKSTFVATCSQRTWQDELQSMHETEPEYLFIWDSGANRHSFPHTVKLENEIPFDNRVTVTDNQDLHVIAKGELGKLKNIWKVQDLNSKLVSVYKAIANFKQNFLLAGKVLLDLYYYI